MWKKTLLAIISLYLFWIILLPESWKEIFASFLTIKSNHLDHKVNVLFTIIFFIWMFVLFVTITYRSWNRAKQMKRP
ncbi:hypothetical protein BAVI_12254 [Neobacillus vireti LMG 21834]|uniref:Uncharacterized protein n=1 Tax=Neobacillus vireti LMG 21834 TaxID=1131730 RepID=A0AB94INE3_9BACI|nr:hypothetical protein BAVI_12254 [Neobacillus vireti LMG 21834]KLT15364.1 hypothetical protein AA980_24705 [Neobacillus vireti]